VAEFDDEDFFYILEFSQFKYRYTCASYVMREKIIYSTHHAHASRSF